MSLAQDLEIYKAADQLLALALQVQAQVPRAHIANALRRRGHAVAGDLSKIYHRPQPCKNSTP